MKKKILITGGTGLVGSYLTEAMLLDGTFEIYILGRNKNEAWAGKHIHYIEVDLATDWDESVLPNDLYSIMHLSQAENFRQFPEKAKEVFYINTLSTLKLINFATQTKVSHFIFASSGGVYGNAENSFNEQANITYQKKTGFYIATKHCSEVLLENYFDQLNVFILRFFFVYGKGQRSEMLIPRLVNFVKAGSPINLQGANGIKVNPIHAQDAALAILATLNIKESHTINVGGPDVLSLKEIGEIIGNELQTETKFIVNEQETPNNLIGDITQMKTLLHIPQIRFKEAIKTLV